MKVKQITVCVLSSARKNVIALYKERFMMHLCTFQAAWLLCNADLSLWDNGFTLRVANVSWDERQTGLLLFLRARVVQRQ